ncbi:hypothetical protein HYPSUDRAFT_576619 [Hypholoma sublateritium FD-334 SS-4]|uniref:Uncharacterized protein n=1 Tax=Hypholoma sublateritium (strain FD-334 SS-4) TaxID=945553 RepID=A0A0D2NXP3_HYPSF|nr:hypothetical protein HYPSUDRAFT_576619 [Hypholoma sublateritium FD-334 SS-4]
MRNVAAPRTAAMPRMYACELGVPDRRVEEEIPVDECVSVHSLYAQGSGRRGKQNENAGQGARGAERGNGRRPRGLKFATKGRERTSAGLRAAKRASARKEEIMYECKQCEAKTNVKKLRVTVNHLRRPRDIRREQPERERERSPRRRRICTQGLEQSEERVECVHGDVRTEFFGVGRDFVR